MKSIKIHIIVTLILGFSAFICYNIDKNSLPIFMVATIFGNIGGVVYVLMLDKN